MTAVLFDNWMMKLESPRQDGVESYRRQTADHFYLQ